MIIDSLDNLQNYAALNPLFPIVVDFVKTHKLEDLKEGKIELQGADLFVNVNVAKGKTPQEARLETHDKMIDIQIPLSCPETMGYTPRCDLKEQPYDAEKDITFYDGLAQQYVTVMPGMFAIFFPQDGHAPCVSGEEFICKIIFKVKA